VEKMNYYSSAKPNEPVVINSGLTDLNLTFPMRIHAFMEDITGGVHRERLCASGRDALEYTWAVIESYESSGELVRQHALLPLHGDPKILLD
jgi:hypothetical protein